MTPHAHRPRRARTLAEAAVLLAAWLRIVAGGVLMAVVGYGFLVLFLVVAA